MHEASLMRGLMKKVAELSEEQGGGKVLALEVWLGALSHMSADHFREHFDHASPGTVAAGAALDITVSDDIHDAAAQEVILRSVEIDT